MLSTLPKIKRLYNLYAADQNPLLLETLEEHKRGLANIVKQITLETEKNVVSNKITKLKKEIDHISDVWDVMTKTEQQTIVRTLNRG